MNIANMLERIKEHLNTASYGPARHLAKIVGEALDASKDVPETLGNYANCCCRFRGRNEAKLTSCEACWWQAKKNLELVMSKLGMEQQ